jgi:Na+-transporting methylmalonyl-CoA/oxaloacetate decarboxylase gamma subunit
MVDMKTIAIPMKLIKVVGITILCSIIFLLVFFITKEIIKRDIKGEAEQVKTEFIDKTVNFNDTAAAKVVATTIHKFSAFKDKVKKELKTLDSADKK